MSLADEHGVEQVDQTQLIWLLSTSMFVTTLAIGFMPLACRFKQANIDRMAVYGAGLMIGAALLVIIPEGVMVLIASQIKQPEGSSGHDHAAEHIDAGVDVDVDAHEHHHHHGTNPEALGEVSQLSHGVASMIGLSMCSGFALMTVIDMLMNIKRELQSDGVKRPLSSQSMVLREEENIQDKYFSVDENNYYTQFVVDDGPEMEHGGHSHSHFDESKSPWVTTVGLVVHSISDGVALGCSIYFSSLASHASHEHSSEEESAASNLGIVIFFAILMHKIPATLGLGTFLTHMKLSAKAIFCHMFTFTSTSPIFGVGSYHLLQQTKLEDSSKQDLGMWVGMLLLLSAGTFLYVATVQILPDVFKSKEKEQQEAHLSGKQRACNRFIDLILMMFGMYSPILLQILVGHHH